MNTTKYLACGECGRVLAAVLPEEPTGILTLECPNVGNGYEHTTVTIDLKKTYVPENGSVRPDTYGSDPGQQDIR